VRLSDEDRKQLVLGMIDAFARIKDLEYFIDLDLGSDPENYFPPGREKDDGVRRLVRAFHQEDKAEVLLSSLRESEWKDAPRLKPILRRLRHIEPVERPAPWDQDDPFQSFLLPPENRPFIGRDGLRKHMKAVAGGRGKRVFVISGKRPCGKSWSWWFLRHVAGRSGQFVPTKLDLTEYAKPPSPHELMKDLAFDLGMPEPPVDTLAKGSTQGRAFARWFQGRLRQMEAHVVVAIDSLDHRRLLADSEDLISRLAKLAAEFGSEIGFTLILLGPKFKLQSLDSFAVGVEEIHALTEDDVRSFLTELGECSAKPLPKAKLDEIIELSFGDPPDDPMEALAQVSVTVANFAEEYLKDEAGVP
jgi:hypothetical protein